MPDETIDGNLSVTGNVGIGTDSPIAHLHVLSSTAAPSKIFLESSGALLKLVVDANGAVMGTDNAFPLSLQTDGNSQLVINSAGNIGIGTNVPITKLEVIGNVKATAFQGNGATLDGIVKKAGDTITGALNLQNILTVSGNVGIGTVPNPANLMVNGAVNATGVMTLANALTVSGNVTVGTIPAPANATVNGTVTATKFVGEGSGLTKVPVGQLEGQIQASQIGTIPASQITGIASSQWVSGSGGSLFYSDGNVGIGTTAPFTQLTLTGSLGFANGTAPLMYIFQSGTSNPDRPIISHSPSFPNWGLSYSDPEDKLIFQSSGTPVMTVALGAQTVGIGTATPSDKLDVAGALRVLTGSNPIRFTSGWTGFPDAVTNQAEICNDTGGYKTLMIVGNRSAGLGRRVSIWDRLEVNGRMSVSEGVIQKGGNPVTSTADLGLYSQAPGFWIRFVTTPGPNGVPGFWFFTDGGGGQSPVAQIDRNGVYTQRSSRQYKENIEALSSQAAFQALDKLHPVQFSYINDHTQRHIGFIAEELPDLVATPDRDMLRSTDIIAVLTKVVKEQQDLISELRERVKNLETQNR